MEPERTTIRLAIIRLAAAAILCAAFPCAGAATGARAAFDRARIHSDYQAGDFEKVIPALEAFLKSGRRCRKEDSVFLEKHLAVVYAADPATRERGRYHMLRMLDLDPQADLLDMFVGEEVDGIFEKVRRESAMRKAPAVRPPSPIPAPRLEAWNLGPEPRSSRQARTPRASNPMASAAVPTATAAAAAGNDAANPSLRPRWKEPGFWVGGGAVVAVVGLSVYFSGVRAEKESGSRTFAVPSKPSE